MQSRREIMTNHQDGPWKTNKTANNLRPMPMLCYAIDTMPRERKVINVEPNVVDDGECRRNWRASDMIQCNAMQSLSNKCTMLLSPVSAHYVLPVGCSL